MSDALDALLAGNKRFVDEAWDPADAERPGIPGRGLAVVACMDTRYTVENVLGLEHGDAKIIRNAGNRIDDAAIRSLVVAVHGMGVRHIAILGHTKCGMTALGAPDYPVAHAVAEVTDLPLEEAKGEAFQDWLGVFDDPEQNIRDGIQAIREDPLMPDDLDLFGLLYDNDTGRVRIVE